jgi:hypothetical protein
MSANDRQVGGSHYGLGSHQHWDIVVEHQLNYFEGQITKYVMRARKKNGLEDLKKAHHFLEKYMEVYNRLTTNPVPAPSERAHPEKRQARLVDDGDGAVRLSSLKGVVCTCGSPPGRETTWVHAMQCPWTDPSGRVGQVPTSPPMGGQFA